MQKITMEQRVSELAPMLEQIEKASVFERPQLGLALAAKMANQMTDMAKLVDDLEQRLASIGNFGLGSLIGLPLELSDDQIEMIESFLRGVAGDLALTSEQLEALKPVIHEAAHVPG